MNVFYFVRRFPRRYQTAIEEKIFSLTQTFLNQGYKMNFVSADLSHPDEYQHLKQYPVNLIPVSSKKISASLSAPQIKPDIAIFNSFQMQEMYAPYMYNKWNKCPRILEVNNAVGLERWRKSKYSTNSQTFIVNYNEALYDEKTVFGESEKKSILRSDFFITPNDFLYYLLKSHTKQPERIAILTHGYPTKEYKVEVKQKQYRPFQSRKHFVFLADLSQQHQHVILFFLITNIWPLIKKQIPLAQLHIYSSSQSASRAKLNKKKLQEQGVIFKGYEEDLQFIQKYKAMLYPARFTTGLKSKIIESWLHHTPVVTTPIGAQGMFYEMLQAKYAAPQAQSDSGFVNERQFTPLQKQAELKLNKYYSSNSLANQNLRNLTFGGSFLNFSHIDFAKSAIQMYNNQQIWQKSLQIGQKTIIKNQNQSQLQINLRQALLKMQLAAYKVRGQKFYDDEWKRVMKTKEYQRKIHSYP